MLCSNPPTASGTMMTIIDVADVTASECLHDGSDLPGLARRHEQVHAVGYQDLSVDLAAPSDLAQVAAVAFVVE